MPTLPLPMLLCAALLAPAAATSLARAAQDAPASSAAGDGLATAREELQAGRADKALEILDGLLESGEGGERDVRLLMAEAQTASGAPDRAVQTLEPLLEAAGGPPDDYELLLAASRTYKAWGDKMSRQGRASDDTDFAYEMSRTHLQGAAEIAPQGRNEATLELGYFEIYAAGEPEAAIARAEKLLAADAKDGEALLLRGCARLQLAVNTAGSGDEAAGAAARKAAIEDLLAADKLLASTRYEPWVQLAWLYEADGQPLPAVDAALAVLDRYPAADFSTLYHLASRYAAEQQFEAAGKALLEMIRRDARQLGNFLAADASADATALHFAWATAPMMDAGRVADARSVLGAVVAADPQVADVWNNYGFVCRELGEHEESFRAYDKALTLDPGNPRLLNDTAVMLHYYLHRDYDRAQELYEQAVEAADARLAEEGLDATARANVEEARRDAVNNLGKLARGEYEWN